MNVSERKEEEVEGEREEVPGTLQNGCLSSVDLDDVVRLAPIASRR